MTTTTTYVSVLMWAHMYSFGLPLFFEEGKLEAAEYITVGDILDANCTMTKYEGSHNASSIYFKLGKVHLPGVKVMSPRKARLFWRTTEKKSVLLVCYVNQSGNSQVLGYKSVTIGKPPQKPTYPQCIVYNWKKMICSWTPTYDEQEQHVGRIVNKQDLTWSIHPTFVHYTCKNMGMNKNTCTWKLLDGPGSFHPDSIYHMQVRIRNPLGAQSSPMVKVYTRDIVKPDPVLNLKVDKSRLSARNLILRWSSPAPNRQLVYKLYYQSEWEQDKESWQVQHIRVPNETESAVVEYTLANLVPYTQYSIKVSAKPRVGGFWSENATVLEQTARTLDDVPAAHPEVSRGGFEIRNAENNRIAIIYWKDISEQKMNGPFIKYLVVGDITRVVEGRRVTQREFSKEALPGERSCSVSLGYDEEADLAVEAVGRIGVFLGTALKIRIEQQSTMPPGVKELVVISYNETIVLVNWKRIPDMEAKVDSYTIYWCKEFVSEKVCHGELQWRILPPVIDQYIITLLPGERYGHYLFAISAESGQSSSGMIWNQCSYEWNGVVHPPKNIHFTSHQEFCSLSFRWEKVTCSPDNRGYVTNFIIRWCPVNKDRECIGDLKNISISSDLYGYTLSGLEAHQEYGLEMISVTADHMSRPSNPIFRTTDDTWLKGGVFAGIVIAASLGILLFLAGLVTTILKCKKCHDRCFRPVEIIMPDKVKDGYNLDADEPTYIHPNEYIKESMNGHVNKYVNTIQSFVNNNEKLDIAKNLSMQLSIVIEHGSLPSQLDNFQHDGSTEQQDARSARKGETARANDAFLWNGVATQVHNRVIEERAVPQRRTLQRAVEKHDMDGELCGLALDNPTYSSIVTRKV